MIEFKSTVLSGENWRDNLDWRQIPPHHTHANCLFGFIEYRIAGKIFKRFSNKFVEAFEKERMWEKLNGTS